MSRHGLQATPCPYRTVEDAGGAFLMGFIGGGVYHGWSVWKTAVPGRRTLAVYSHMRRRVPKTSLLFGAWGMLYSTSECAWSRYRRRDDPLNSVLGGATTGAFLAIRGGPGKMVRGAMFGAFFLSIIEGIAHSLMSLTRAGGQVGPPEPLAPPPPMEEVGKALDPWAPPPGVDEDYTAADLGFTDQENSG